MKPDTKLKILDLGCGKKKRKGAIGVDFSDKHEADVIHNLNVFPYPFGDEVFDEVYLDNVLEHLDDPIRVMEEVNRICKKKAIIKVIVPYFRSIWAFIDPTHKNFFTVNSFSYFDPRSPTCHRYEYTSARFYVEDIVFNETLPNRWLKRVMIFIANKYPNKYEFYLSHLFPLDDITYYLKKC
ncbi:methyltransferase domain-containing protein [Candidatus Methylopumilus rimovensis]|uniref:Methyltransferase domain-containing protein n=1 Tax=Candidatus Methylopumilus rimovensis TaxID=2588535 RepID=A0AAF1D7V6_9PROT|nr:methyltransferase domain-containing protein [Candidatus Methylopumilus rimovensis]